MYSTKLIILTYRHFEVLTTVVKVVVCLHVVYMVFNRRSIEGTQLCTLLVNSQAYAYYKFTRDIINKWFFLLLRFMEYVRTGTLSAYV